VESHRQKSLTTLLTSAYPTAKFKPFLSGIGHFQKTIFNILNSLSLVGILGWLPGISRLFLNYLMPKKPRIL